MEKGNHPEIVSPAEDREDRSEVLRRLFTMARNIDGFQGKTAQYTEDLIDIFEHPDKPEYKVGRDDQEVRMIDYFKRRIANGVMLIE